MAIAPAIVFCAQPDMESILSPEGVLLRQDDDGDGAASAREQALVTWAINLSTSRVGMRLSRYTSAQLQQSVIVTYWTALMASCYFCSRRGNGVPESLSSDLEVAMDEMKEVQKGELDLLEIVATDVNWPAWSNVRVVTWARLYKIRVERGISEGSPTTFPRTVDQAADYYSYEQSTGL